MHMKLLAAAAVTLGLAAGLTSGQANATVLDLTNGSVTFTASGILYNGVLYYFVQQQDKLYSGFTGVTGLTGVFELATIGGVDTHSITFTSNTASLSGGVHTIGYTIAVDQGPKVFTSTSSDLVQSAGSATLDETVTPGGTINFTKTGSSSYSASTDLPLPTHPISLAISETLTPGLLGTNVSAIQNSFTQSAPGPVPGAGYAGLFALALAGLYTRARRA